MYLFSISTYFCDLENWTNRIKQQLYLMQIMFLNFSFLMKRLANTYLIFYES